MNMVGGAKSDSIAMAASASIQGDVTIMPLSNTPIDMSVFLAGTSKIILLKKYEMRFNRIKLKRYILEEELIN